MATNGRDESTYVSVIKTGPTNGRDESTYASVIRTTYPGGRAESTYVSVIVPIEFRRRRPGVIISDG